MGTREGWLTTRMAKDPVEFLETALFWGAKTRPTRKDQNDTWALGSLIRPRGKPGMMPPQTLSSQLDKLAPNVRNALSNWVCEGDAAFVNHAKPLLLAPRNVNQRRTMLEQGLKILGENIPLISDKAGYAKPPVSTTEHDNEMLYFNRSYAGGQEPPKCAHGDQACCASLLFGAPGALPVYMSMTEHTEAMKSPERAKLVIEEMGSSALCLLCLRAECKAIALGSNNKIVNSGEQLRRFTAIQPPFTNLVNCAGGYLERYIAVSPVKTPQICTACIVDGHPLKNDGESALEVVYDHYIDEKGTERGLRVKQDSLIWTPGNWGP